ncbi:60S acidic ribosomal protein P2-4 [Abeliophyllum distichum]|uniref:60S acidic ribosomal protein P2-4 n=1 Tax=Abeliophyllum distichum TaxID=126358 RepID=A0ABD1RGF5_9LAMI
MQPSTHHPFVQTIKANRRKFMGEQKVNARLLPILRGRHTISLTNKMKVIAAYLLAVLGGNASPSADDLKDILSSVGAEANDDQIGLLLTQVTGKDITELIAAGREKLASVPAGGGAVAVASAGSGATGGAAAPAAAEPKKEEKVEEKEESDDDMGFSLFD